MVVLPVTVLTVEVLFDVVVTADVRRGEVTSMYENVVGAGVSAVLLPFVRVVVTAGALAPDTVVTVVPFGSAVSPT